MSKRIIFFIMALSVILMLSACGRSVPVKDDSILMTLPPVENRYKAPQSDLVREHAETVLLYLPSVLNNQLITVPERILIPADQHPAEATVRKLLSFNGSEVAKSLFPEASLQIQNSAGGMEISGEVATVNLSANALLLSKPDLFTLRRALTNTILQWRDIRFVNVLVSGIEPGIDQTGLSPAGSMQSIRNEDAQSVWDGLSNRSSIENIETLRFSSLCTLYFPASFGRGILSEARTVSFPGLNYRQLAGSLLEALSAGPQILSQSPLMPELNTLLAEPIRIEENDTGSFVIALHFIEEANEAFINAGIPRSIMMASITTTMCTFIPQLDGLKIQIGNEQIEGIVPGGIYEKAGEQIIFSGNILRRADFSSFLLSDCTLYFADRSGSLNLVHRPIPYQFAFNNRFILEQLIKGPQMYDSITGLLPVFSQEMNDKDLIAIEKEGSTVHVNFTDKLISISELMPSHHARLMIYSIVNTLCNTRGVSKVRIYVNSEQPDIFAGSVYLPGEFFKNPEIIKQ